MWGIFSTILEIIKGFISWKGQKDLLDAGRALQKEEDNEKITSVIARRDNLTDADVDRMLKPPAER